MANKAGTHPRLQAHPPHTTGAKGVGYSRSQGEIDSSNAIISYATHAAGDDPYVDKTISQRAEKARKQQQNELSTSARRGVVGNKN